MPHNKDYHMHFINYPKVRLTPKHKASGFSLVEVLVAAAILGIVVVAIVAVIRKGSDMESIGRQRMAARVFLTARDESLFAMGSYASVTPAPGGTPVSFGGNGCYNGDFYVFVDQTPETIQGTQIPVKRVTLALAWTDLDDIRDSIALTHWITE